MKILFVHSGSDLYGASRSLLRLSTRLARDGHSVEVVLPSSGLLCDELKKSGVVVRVQKSLSIIDRFRFGSLKGLMGLLVVFPASVLMLAWHMRRMRPDVVHSNTSVILSSGPATKLASIPHVWHVRESFSEFPWLFRWYQWYMYMFSTRICCVSSPIAEQFHAAIRSRRTVVIHDGFPRSEFENINQIDVAEFRRQFGLLGKIVVGLVGRVRLRRKGQEIFVRAASFLHRTYSDARFVIIGSPFPGNEEHLVKLKALIQDLQLGNCVVYTGDARNIKAAMSSLDISVLASVIPEPFGGVVIEAMALAKPVVGTSIGGTLEQVDHGVSGFLVPPGDDLAMAEAIGKLLADRPLREEMGVKGRQRFLERFEFEAFYEQMLALYSKVMRLRSNIDSVAP